MGCPKVWRGGMVFHKAEIEQAEGVCQSVQQVLSVVFEWFVAYDEIA